MIRRFTTLLLLTAMLFPAAGRTTRTVQLNGGGSGPYKAIIVEDSELPGYSIFRPEDLKHASGLEGPLPVILFGNGGCSHSSVGFYGFLSELASHGYVIISNGEWTDRVQTPRPGGGGAPRVAPPAPGAQAAAPAAHVPQQDPAKHDDALAILAKLDWFESKNAEPDGEYSGTLDTSCAIAMGQSCGGLQAIVMSTAGDPRIRTTVALNTGVFPDPYVVDKAVLDRLAAPIVYLIGGETDIAYPNAMDDFQRIDKVPVAIANLPVGHGGTYRDPNGGQFADMALLWLEWQVRGRGDGEKVFRYCQVPEGMDEWVIHSRGFTEEKVFSLPGGSGGEENVGKNAYGEVNNYSSVKNPSIAVRLPDPGKATGASVLIFPGGGLMSLSWESEFRDIANWLNARGIAAIGVKYRTRDMSAFRPQAGGAPAGGARPAGAGAPSAQQRDFSKITGFGVLEHANASPSTPVPGVVDPTLEAAAGDCLNALRFVREHAPEWGLVPARMGVMGFSAGGGVELAALSRAEFDDMPAFVCSVYGPSLEDIYVKDYFPPLFIAVHADHRNVAAGCLALFLEWKKAGVDAEMHVYGEGTGGLFGGGGSTADRNTRAGYWLESFYSWLHAKGFLR